MHVADHPSDILRPFLWIGGLSFATGFLGYLALGMQLVQAG